MTTSLVLTFIGHDKPGLVNAISEKVAAAGASWHESRLARLAGEFAGIVLIHVQEGQAAALTASLRGLGEIGLLVTVEAAGDARPVTYGEILELNILGQDRAGIVRDVTHALSKIGVNIEEFTSGIESAPFTGETMFRANARLQVPDGVTGEAVRKALERLADEIMVDLTQAPAG